VSTTAHECWHDRDEWGVHQTTKLHLLGPQQQRALTY
jgi:hypothetical protein